MARIGLVQVDGKWANLALMRLSAYHKAKGDQVEWYNPLFPSDVVYASKTFVTTPDDAYLPADCIRGGTGYDLTTVLPDEVESCFPDYSLYPSMDYAIGLTTRGCVRNCSFCFVPRKEGKLRIVGDLYDFWNGQQKQKVILLDNNLTAAPMAHFEKIINQLAKERVLVDFSQGLDIRLLTEDHARLLKTVRFKYVHFAWDSMGYEKAVRRGVEILTRYIHPQRLTFYVLVGYDTTEAEDMYRIEVLRGLGVNPFVMAYDKQDRYQKAIARWCNHKAIFKTVSWRDYQSGKRKTKGQSEIFDSHDRPPCRCGL